MTRLHVTSLGLRKPEARSAFRAELFDAVRRQAYKYAKFHSSLEPIMRVCAAGLFLGLTFWPALAAGQMPLGPLFRVNTYTTGNQLTPRSSSDEAGNFIVTWVSTGQDGSEEGVFARSYDWAGAPITPAEWRVNAYTTGSQSAASVGATPNGQVLFAWQASAEYLDDYGFVRTSLDIFGRQFSLGGVPDGDDVRLNTSLPYNQWAPSVSAGYGNFVVAWNSQPDGPYGYSSKDMVGRTLQSPGDFTVNSTIPGSQSNELNAAAMDRDGRFVVVWRTGYRIFARRFDQAGVPGPEFIVKEESAYFPDVGRPSVASDPAGNFVVVWAQGYYWGSGYFLMGRRYDAAGVAQGEEFVVSNHVAYTYDAMVHRPSVAMDGRGGFVVAWQEYVPALGVDAMARTYDGSGPAGPPFAVHSDLGTQGAPSVVSNRAGDFLVTWQGEDWDGSYDVFGRRFRPELIFRDGFERGDLSAWSGSSPDGGDLSVDPAAALPSPSPGLRGLKGVVDDTAAIYVEDGSPNDEPRYRARFWFDPNGFDPGVAQGHLRTRMFIAFTAEPTRRVAAIVVRLQAGQYSLMGRARLDDNSQADTGFVLISDGPHAVEFDLTPASGPDALDGSFRLYVDGVLERQRTVLDNSLAAVDFVRMGALSAKSGANGTIYWDGLESRRENYIGP